MSTGGINQRFPPSGVTMFQTQVRLFPIHIEISRIACLIEGLVPSQQYIFRTSFTLPGCSTW